VVVLFRTKSIKIAYEVWQTIMQGNALSQSEIRTIISLLKSTDMSIGDIAERMTCSRSAIAAVNRRFNVRDYAGQRSHWSVTIEEVMNGVSNGVRSNETVRS
jgi:hypothetical protein